MKLTMKMLSRLVLAFVVSVVLVGPMTPSFAAPRAAGGTTQATTEESGNTLTPFNTAIGTTTAVIIYTKTGNRVDRSVHVCNPASPVVQPDYVLLLSTSSAVNGVSTTDARAMSQIAAGDCNDYNAFPQSVYAVYRATASGVLSTFPTLRPFGFKRYDSRD